MKRSLFTQHVHPDEPVHYNLISHFPRSQWKTGFLLPSRTVWCSQKNQPFTRLQPSLLYHLFRRVLSSRCVYGAHFMPDIYLPQLSWGRFYPSLHFISDTAEPQRGEVACLRSHSLEEPDRIWSLATAAFCTQMRWEDFPCLDTLCLLSRLLVFFISPTCLPKNVPRGSGEIQRCHSPTICSLSLSLLIHNVGIIILASLEELVIIITTTNTDICAEHIPYPRHRARYLTPWACLILLWKRHYYHPILQMGKMKNEIKNFRMCHHQV